MNIVIDLELEEVVSDFGSRIPIDTIEVKNQDTPIMAVYFVQRGTNFDLGSSPGIRFGLFQAGNPNPLVQCSTFTRVTDATNRICYRGYPNFNTTSLAGAIGVNNTVDCLGEWRYQTSGGTISRTQDVNFTIQRVLLSETILDYTTAFFIMPAVGSTVSIAIGSTTWLKSGLIVSIGAGAGNYTVTSITDATHFIAQNNGGTGNAAPGTSIPVGTTVGIAPSTIISTYPDPSVIEVTTHKGAANGYAGLDANTLLLASRVPVDGQTISALPSGKIGLSSILATVAANFTTSAANANVSVMLNSTTNLVAGAYVRIPIAGYYIVESVTSGTVAVLQNNGDPFNAASGVTITTGAVLLPAQAAAAGGTGTAGANAFTTTLANFTVPAAGLTVNVNLGATNWLSGSGYVVFIAGAGYYAVSSITDSTHAVLTNLGYTATNAAPGTVITSGANVSPGGVAGAQGVSGTAGANAYDTTTASFVMPTAAASVNVTINTTTWLSTGQMVYIQGAGYFSVATIISPVIFSATNANYPGAAAPGSTISSGAKVSAAGLIGPQGAGGAGLNSFTTLTSNFTQPAVGNPVTIVVGTTAWMVATEVIYIAGGGYYQINSIGDLTHVTLANLGYAGNAAPAATVPGSGVQGISPGGLIGPSGSNPYTTTTANFTMPASGTSVPVALGSTAFMVSGHSVYVQGAGYFTVASVTDSTHAVLTNNIGATGNVASGTVIASGAGVATTGSPGPAGPQGATGPSGGIGEAPTDGQIYGRQNSAWTPVTGGGGANYLDPDNGMIIREMFFMPYSTPGAGGVQLMYPWQLNGTGTIGGSSIGTAAPSLAPASAIAFYTNTATSTLRLSLGFSANTYETDIPIGLGVATVKIKAAVDTLITSTDALIHQSGLIKYNSTDGNLAGLYFEYNYANSANWVCVASTGNGTGANVTRVDSGVAVAALTWVRFRIVTNAAWTSVGYYINNTLVGTITTTLPTAASDKGLQCMPIKTIRTAYAAIKYFILDDYYFQYQAQT